MSFIPLSHCQLDLRRLAATRHLTFDHLRLLDGRAPGELGFVMATELLMMDAGLKVAPTLCRLVEGGHGERDHVSNEKL